jgi:O-antigen/teichoic acid export membrane protein
VTATPAQSTVRGAVTGFMALGAATALSQLMLFAALTLLSRRLGPQGVGAFSFAVNLVGYFAIPANFGVTALAIRDLARHPDEARRITGEVLVLQLALCVAPYALLVALAPVLAADADSRALLPVVGLGFIVEALALSWVLYATRRFTFVAVARVAGAALFLALVLALVDDGDRPLALGWIHVAGGALTGALTLWAALRLTGRPRLRQPAGTLARRFRAGVPLGVSAVMVSIYYTVDSIMLGYLEDTETVGQYAIAYRVPLAVIAFAGLWHSVVYPHFSALATRSAVELREQLGWFTSLTLAVSLPLLAGAIIVGPSLVPQLFGDRYGPAGTPFVLLMGAAALVLVTITWAAAQVAAGDERHAMVAVTCGAALNVAANLVLIPLFDTIGAAAATVGAEAVVLAYTVLRLRRRLGPVPLDTGRIGRALGATALMVAVVLACAGALSPIGQVAAGVAAYAAAALALGVVRVDELRRLLPRGEGA